MHGTAEPGYVAKRSEHRFHERYEDERVAHFYPKARVCVSEDALLFRKISAQRFSQAANRSKILKSIHELRDNSNT